MKNIIKSKNDETLVKEYIERGKGLFNDGEYKKAFKDFNKAILLNSEYSQTYLVKAQAHIALFEVDEAEICMNNYLKLNPYDPKGCFKLIDIHDLTGDFDKCVYYCDKLLEIDDENLNIHLKKAEFLTLLYDYEGALKCFDTCLNLCPDFYEALCGKAKILLSLQNKKVMSDINVVIQH
jgi:tetratricopeptide (TPR) repeat protein